MLASRIIPCLDVHGGRVVKGINFVNLVDAGDPVEQAKLYDSAGADELCFLDILQQAMKIVRPFMMLFPKQLKIALFLLQLGAE